MLKLFDPLHQDKIQSVQPREIFLKSRSVLTIDCCYHIIFPNVTLRFQVFMDKEPSVLAAAINNQLSLYDFC